MKLSTKSQYAVKLMLNIAAEECKGNVSIKEVAKKENIPAKYLEQIVNILCKSGFVKSKRGSQGGYRLAKSANEYTLGNVIRAVEGEISADYIEDISVMRDFWNGLYETVNRYMDSITIGDLLEEEKINNEVYEYYI